MIRPPPRSPPFPHPPPSRPAPAGFDARLTDSKPDALRFAMGRLNALLAIAVRRGKLPEQDRDAAAGRLRAESDFAPAVLEAEVDRKSTRLNSSHGYISYAVFCLKKKKQD